MNWKEKREIMLSTNFDYPLEVASKNKEDWEKIIVENAWESFKQTLYFDIYLSTLTCNTA